MRKLLSAVILTFVAATTHAKTVPADVWLCAMGQFNGDDGTAIEIDNAAVALGDTCELTPVKVKSSKKRTVLTAVWAKCDGYKGRVRVVAKLAAGACDQVDVQLRAKKVNKHFRANRSKGSSKDCQTSGTFEQIQRRIFGPKGCRVETCHGDARSGGLDLRLDAAYDSLVGVAANGAPGALRVAPGHSADSFLVRKLAGILNPGEGDRMPSVGHPLRALELDMIRTWIDAGAPEAGTVADEPCPPPHRYEPAPTLAPPPGGYQIVYEGPVLQPGEEVEGCEWIEAPNTEDFLVGRWEYSLNPGTHHFGLWAHRPQAALPAMHTWKKETACISGGAEFGTTITGAPEAPYFVDDYTGNLAKVVKGGSILGINPHYFNEFDVPIQIRIVLNMYPAASNATLAKSLVTTDAALNGKGTFSIFVPPNSVETLRVRWSNNTGSPISIPQLGSHMHKRGVLFEAWSSDGTLIYENTDWAHPRLKNFDPPLTLAPGDYLEYQCTHDNGVTRPVRLCGEAEHDKNCTPGEPIPITFNVSAQDEMCLLTGLYY